MTFFSVLSSFDEKKLKIVSEEFRDLADLIIEREQTLQKLHDFAIFDSDSARFWGSSSVFNPLKVRCSVENNSN